VEPFDNLATFQQLGFIAGCAERGLRELSRFRKLIRIDSSALRPAATFLWQCVPRAGQLSAKDPVLADHINQVGLVHDLTAPGRNGSYPKRVLNDVAGIILSGLGLLRNPARGETCATSAGLALLGLIEALYEDPTGAEVQEWSWQERFIIHLASLAADQIDPQVLDELSLPDYGEPEQFGFPLESPE
jgi:hypothetical protein